MYVYVYARPQVDQLELLGSSGKSLSANRLD